MGRVAGGQGREDKSVVAKEEGFGGGQPPVTQGSVFSAWHLTVLSLRFLVCKTGIKTFIYWLCVFKEKSICEGTVPGIHEIQNGIKFEGGDEKRSKENRRGI